MRPVGLNGKKKLSDIFTGLKMNIEEKSRALVIVLPGSARLPYSSSSSSLCCFWRFLT